VPLQAKLDGLRFPGIRLALLHAPEDTEGYRQKTAGFGAARKLAAYAAAGTATAPICWSMESWSQ
jgi:hypothetical protein